MAGPPVSGCSVTGALEMVVEVVADVPGGAVVVVAVPARVVVVAPEGAVVVGAGATVVVVASGWPGAVVVDRPVVTVVVALGAVVVVAPGWAVVVRVSSPRRITTVDTPAAKSSRMSTNSALAVPRRTAGRD